MKLLHIIASPRGETSRTLSISKEFLLTLKEKHKDLTIDEIDLFKVKLPDVSLSASTTKYALMSGGNVDESSKSNWDEILGFSMNFLTYDYFLITCPMWNFTIPYVLKHYIDVIMQAGVLFNFTETGVAGLAINKKMICVTSRGSDYSQGTYMNQFDFQEPYLRAIFGMIGIYDISFINAQPLDIAPALTEASLVKAKGNVTALASSI
ncbi:ACP phosphodiesterase [Lacihabitans sp. CCS-44]|uniref:FMN-dependent NADH-azoreductase n=1 Tax=Lacihabitans sp. CCS-44 TaxID=2487331 RepID=UPI0020CC58C4|nr:NAD(P)H-dependent oxidoreductase [Lacihabitans sp. CCS-44]MCP9756219.1 ACP phosphodiesterase [Lacihabitans sp. CCS-44]